MPLPSPHFRSAIQPDVTAHFRAILHKKKHKLTVQKYGCANMSFT